MCRSKKELTIVVRANPRDFAAPFVWRRPDRRFVEESRAGLEQDKNSLLGLTSRGFRQVADCGIDRAAPELFEQRKSRRCRLHCAKARANRPRRREVEVGCA